MALTLVSHNQYTGASPSVTLSGGATSTDRVVVILSASNGDADPCTGITLNGSSMTLLGQGVLSGGIEAPMVAAEIQNIGSGSYSLAYTGLAGISNQTWDVYEFSDANPADNFQSATLGGQSSQPFNISVAGDNLSGEWVIYAAVVGEGGGSATESITNNASLSSYSGEVINGGLVYAGGYKATASDDESVQFTVDGMTLGGGNLDRTTAIAVRVTEFNLTPEVTLDDDTLSPGDTISGSYQYFSSIPTSPVTITGPDGNTMDVTVTVNDSGLDGNSLHYGTFSGTMPSLPAVDNSANQVLFGACTVTLD